MHDNFLFNFNIFLIIFTVTNNAIKLVINIAFFPQMTVIDDLFYNF